MQQIFEFFFVLILGVFLQRQIYLEARGFQDIRDVVVAGFSILAVLGDELAPNLIDFGGRELRCADLPRYLQDQLFLCCVRIGHRLAPRCAAPAAPPLGVMGPAGAPFSGEAPGVAAGALAPAGFFNNCRYFVTLRLCSSSDAAKKCPPCVFATKYKNCVFVGLIAALSDSSPGFPI